MDSEIPGFQASAFGVRACVLAVFPSFRRWFWALGLDFGFGPELLSASGMGSGLGLGFRLWAGAHARNGTTPSFSLRGNVLAGCKNGVHSSHVASSFQKPDVSAVIFGKKVRKKLDHVRVQNLKAQLKFIVLAL